MHYDDTIAAIATPPGVGGIGVIRVSGPDALPVLERCFAPTRAGRWHPARMRHGYAIGPAGERIDEALAVFFRAPHSFTAEDVAELSCHGGPLVLGTLLDAVLGAGARHANPGEFTMRAFLNGRMDLAQAEAVADVISARTSAGLALAQAQLGGWLGSELRPIRAALLEALAYCTALVDFPEDDIDAEQFAAPLATALARLEQLIAGADQGIMVRQGARAAIVGLPNAGKSSLLNALLRADRAIVTPIPGTTRDTLEETANLAGVPVVLIDTAGINESADPVERLGVQRSRQALAGADIALLVLDATSTPGEAECEVAALTIGRPTVLVLNKVDLLDNVSWDFTVWDGGMWGDTPHAPLVSRIRDEPFAAIVTVSALTGQGVSALAGAVAAVLLGGPAHSGEQLVNNPRHRDALVRAADHLRDTLAALERNLPADLLAVDLTAALGALGEITGEGVGDELLDLIFSKFCIGK
jgi:tRNA modification GTPase